MSTTSTKNSFHRITHRYADSKDYQPELSRQPGDGANDWTADQWDANQHISADLFPVDAERTETDRKNGAPFSPARTTFEVSQQFSRSQDPTFWTRQKRLQHDVGRDYTGRNRTRDTLRRNDYHRRYDAILQSLEVPAPVRHYALRRALREDTAGFNGHYNGYHGAVLGFALLGLTDNLDDALSSNWFDRMETLIDELPDDDVDFDAEALAEYVFRTYGPTGGEA